MGRIHPAFQALQPVTFQPCLGDVLLVMRDLGPLELRRRRHLSSGPR